MPRDHHSELPPMQNLNVELFTQRLVTDLGLNEQRAKRIAETFAEQPPMILDERALKAKEEAGGSVSNAYRAEFDMLGADLQSEEGAIDFRNHPVGQELVNWVTSNTEKLDEEFQVMFSAATKYLDFMIEEGRR